MILPYQSIIELNLQANSIGDHTATTSKWHHQILAETLTQSQAQN